MLLPFSIIHLKKLKFLVWKVVYYQKDMYKYEKKNYIALLCIYNISIVFFTLDS